MSVSRRGFLQGLGVGRTSHASAFIAARGHEELVAEAMQQGRQGGGMRRPALPPGVEAIRISSNENPLGPGKAAIDAILGKFPEANRYPFNSTPLDADLEILLAKLNTAKRENVVLGVGSQELLKNAARVFMSPTKHLVIPSPTYGDPAGFAQNVLKYTVKSAPVSEKTLKTDLAALHAARQGRRSRLHLQPEQPDRDDQQRAGDQGFRRRGEEDLADHRDPDRRSVLRLRQRSGLPDGDSGRAGDARRPRRTDLLQGLRHGRRPHRLRDWRRSPP